MLIQISTFPSSTNRRGLGFLGMGSHGRHGMQGSRLPARPPFLHLSRPFSRFISQCPQKEILLFFFRCIGVFETTNPCDRACIRRTCIFKALLRTPHGFRRVGQHSNTPRCHVPGGARERAAPHACRLAVSTARVIATNAVKGQGRNDIGTASLLLMDLQASSANFLFPSV
jgi:hypothetical protein